jgi:hypothetical protein
VVRIDLCSDYNITDGNVFEAASHSDKQYRSRFEVSNGTLALDRCASITCASLNDRNSEAHAGCLEIPDLVLGSSRMNDRVNICKMVAYGFELDT